MNLRADNLLSLVETIQERAPEYLDLMTSESDEQFERALDRLLEQSIHHLEANKVNFRLLDETGLSAVLAGRMTIPGVTVTQETHSNGHVDLTITVDHCIPMRKSLGEAKVYRGPAYHIEAISQLLDRYTTGREGRGLIIVYVNVPDIQAKIDGIRVEMDKALPRTQRGPTAHGSIKWSFLSTHGHSCGCDCRVGHFACNLHVPNLKQP